MKRFLRIVGITTLVAVFALSAVSGASAQGPQGNGNTSGLNLWERMQGALADALGVTAERLSEAFGSARSAVVNEAVEEGLIDDGQAQRWLDRGADGSFGWGMRGMDSRRGGMPGYRNSLVGVAAEQFGMSVQELTDELEAGKTLAEFAQVKGVDTEAIVGAYLATRTDALDQAVANGRLTQEAADEMLAHVEEEARNHLTAAYPFECDSDECSVDGMQGLMGQGGRFNENTDGTRGGRGGRGMMGQGSL